MKLNYQQTKSGVTLNLNQNIKKNYENATKIGFKERSTIA